LKTQLRLPIKSGNFSFKVAFSKPLPARNAIFVVRPIHNSGMTEESTSSLGWSNQARGYFLYSPLITQPHVLISSRFSLELPGTDVELEVLPWSGANLEGVVESITLISRPTADDSVFTTYVEGRM